MALPRRLAATFAPPLRAQGDVYVREGRVELVSTSPSLVRARVAGRELHEVDIRAVGDDRLALHCTCPYARDHGNCRHLWAVLMVCDREGTLPSVPDDTWLAEVRAARAADAEARRLQQERREAMRLLDVQPPVAALPESLARSPAEPVTPPPPDARAWVRELRALAPAMSPRGASGASGLARGRREAAPFPAARRIVYVVDVAHSRRRQDGLVVELGLETRQKSGMWGATRRFTLTRSQWFAAPDPVDREIAQMLLGTPGELGQHAPGSAGSRFLLPPEALDTTLRRMCESQRCRARLETAAQPLEPLAWDDGPAWSLRLTVTPSDDGASYRLAGELERDGERMPMEEPHLLLEAGLVLARGVAARWTDHGAFALAERVRAGPPLTVPAAEVTDLVAELYALPHLPPIVLPPELQLDTRRGAPVPALSLRAIDATPWSPARLVGALAFDYEGTLVAADASAPFGGTGDERNPRRQVLRNRPAEAEFTQRLERAGFRWEYDYAAARTVLRIAATRGDEAAIELAREGWRVDVGGRALRTAGPLELEVHSGIDWFDLQATVDFAGVTAELPALLAALRRGERTIRLDDGSLGVLDGGWLGQSGLLAAAGTMVDGRLRFAARQLGVLDALLSALPPADTDAAFEHARRRLLDFEGVRAADPPDGFHGTLRPYQREGLGWLHFLREFGLGGCLADDMGLGKTVQVLALLAARRAEHQERGTQGTSLVVVPRSLVFNWEQEVARFTPALKVLVHRGPDRARRAAPLADHDLVITTYGTLRRDVVMLRELEFDYAILDEAQAIKNAATAGAKAARLLRARHRLAMSGTPVENRLQELWSLLEFLNPGMLGKASVFATRLRALEGSATVAERDEARALVARAVRPCFLRRTKAQVAPELPERLEQTLVVELSPKERVLYDELRDHYRHSLLGRVTGQGLGKARMHVLEALLRLRQAACHPGLVDPARRGESSSKIDLLLTRVAEATAEGHKVLVFSQFTSLLSIVRTQFDAAGIPYAYLDGATQDRQRVVEEFQENPECRAFLISLKAGGLGLNLTAAEYVYLLDPWWNPAVEAQAIDRAHRIGQTRRVFASRLIARDTVEEKVLALQGSKRELAEAIIRADDSVVTSLGREELELLLS